MHQRSILALLNWHNYTLLQRSRVLFFLFLSLFLYEFPIIYKCVIKLCRSIPSLQLICIVLRNENYVLFYLRIFCLHSLEFALNGKTKQHSAEHITLAETSDHNPMYTCICCCYNSCMLQRYPYQVAKKKWRKTWRRRRC